MSYILKLAGRSHYAMHNESHVEVIQVPDSSAIYLTSNNHPKIYMYTDVETRFVVRVTPSPGHGLVLRTLYPMDVAPRANGSCSEASLLLTSYRNGQGVTREYCGQDEIDMGDVTGDELQLDFGWAAGTIKHYSGFAVRIDSKQNGTYFWGRERGGLQTGKQKN